MIQGVFDSGKIVKTQEYLFPPTVRIPQDYFDHAVEQELMFLESFLEEVRADKDFSLTDVQENFSIYFPRLFTLEHGYIDWEWSGRDIELFICAFDDPYPGASTFLNGNKVFLKDCYLEFNDGPFHPFQSGLVYKKDHNALFTAAREGTLIIKKIFLEDGTSAFDHIKTGDRLYTPGKYLEEAMQYRAEFDGNGLVGHKKT
jgi:methionyl-tRNA formyltransferase